jgi:hypothetical protein
VREIGMWDWCCLASPPASQPTNRPIVRRTLAFIADFLTADAMGLGLLAVDGVGLGDCGSV